MVDLGMLVLRVISGVMMVLFHGWGKILGIVSFFSGKGWKFVDTVSSIGFPLPGLFAVLAGLIEFLSSILIILGLFTRVNAGLLAFVMLVATYYNIRVGASYELSLLYLTIFVVMIIIGAGKYSLDYSMFRKK